MTTQKATKENTAEPKPGRAPRGVQPKKQADKSRVAVKMRRSTIIKELLAGKTAQEAGIIAGFSPKTAGCQVAQTLKNPKVQNLFIAEMERSGLGDDYLVEHHKRLIEAKKVISANFIFSGDESGLKEAGSTKKCFVEVPDFVAKAKGLEMAYKLTGRFVDRHELDIKQPVNITIKKFCSRGQKEGNGDSNAAFS